MLMLNLSTILINFDYMCGWNSFWKFFLPVLLPICSVRKKSWSNQWSELNSGLCRNWEMLVLQVWQTRWSWRRVKLQTFWNHQATPLTSTGICFLTWIFLRHLWELEQFSLMLDSCCHLLSPAAVLPCILSSWHHFYVGLCASCSEPSANSSHFLLLWATAAYCMWCLKLSSLNMHLQRMQGSSSVKKIGNAVGGRLQGQGVLHEDHAWCKWTKSANQQPAWLEFPHCQHLLEVLFSLFH